jgi:hypothetical protein
MTIEPTFTPHIQDGRAAYTSRIRFRLFPESRDLARRMLAEGAIGVYPGDGMRFWPLDEQTGLIEIAHYGPLSESSLLEFAQRFDLSGQIHVLPGSPEIVPAEDFQQTNPRRT